MKLSSLGTRVDKLEEFRHNIVGKVELASENGKFEHTKEMVGSGNSD